SRGRAESSNCLRSRAGRSFRVQGSLRFRVRGLWFGVPNDFSQAIGGTLRLGIVNQKPETANHKPQPTMEHGLLAIILHAHLPFVRHPEYPEFLEEEWLFEAISETYLPLLSILEGCAADGVRARITMGLTPPLCEMLSDPLLQERYLRHVSKLVELCEKEVIRTRHHPAMSETAK